VLSSNGNTGRHLWKIPRSLIGHIELRW
jgi:hypothetical protein